MRHNGHMSDSTDEQPAIGGSDVITTVLAHRGSRSTEWWHTATVHHLGDVTDAPLDAAALEALTDALSPLARLGATAVSVRVPRESTGEAGAAMSAFLARADQLGVRVLLAMSPEELDDVATMRTWLTRGVAGVEVQRPSDSAPHATHEQFRRLHALLAELTGPETIIVTSVPADDADELNELLYEDWPHHAVDTSLTRIPTAGGLQTSIGAAISARDTVGVPATWLLPATAEVGSAARARALALVGAALPGAVHVRTGIDIAASAPQSTPASETIRRWATYARERRGVPGSTFELLRTSLRLRQEFRLGVSPMAWVEGRGAAADADVLSFFTGEVLVLANLGGQTHPLPEGLEVLITSAPDALGSLPPDSAVWLWLEPATPQPDLRAKRS